MSKKTQKPDIPNDMWLHVATDALARYAAAEDTESVAVAFNEHGMAIYITGIKADDLRLAPSLVEKIHGALKRPE